MALAFVVSTLGRIDALRLLFSSLESQLAPEDRLVVVAQDKKFEISSLLTEFSFSTTQVKLVESGRGASLGRNTGVDALDDDFDYFVFFPNDTSYYPSGMLDLFRNEVGNAPTGAVTVIDELGPKFVLPSRDTRLDKLTVWKVIEPGYWILKSLFVELGGFDSDIGTGASTPWQAGEVGDLLLRYLEYNPTAPFAWGSSDLFVSGVSHASGLTSSQRRRKQRAYGRGFGFLATRWNYPLWFKAAIIVHGLLGGFTFKGKHPFDGPWIALGRWEGLRGKILGKASDVRAVAP